jgi:hypothetical protein
VKFPFTGFCGKTDQWVPVEGIGPAMLLKDISLGGGGPFGARPWGEVVAEFDRQRIEVAIGKRDANAVHIPEIAEDLPGDQSQQNICLVTSCFASVQSESEWIVGKRPDNSTHEFTEDGKIRERRNLYDHK